MKKWKTYSEIGVFFGRGVYKMHRSLLGIFRRGTRFIFYPVNKIFANTQYFFHSASRAYVFCPQTSSASPPPFVFHFQSVNSVVFVTFFVKICLWYDEVSIFCQRDLLTSLQLRWLRNEKAFITVN